MTDLKAYGDDEENDRSSWTEVDVDGVLGLPDDGCPAKFHLFLKRYKSSSPAWEEFLHDPLRQMLMDPGELVKVDGWPSFPGDDSDDPRDNVEGGALQAIREDPRWHVTTFVTNHHRKLSRIHTSVTLQIGKPPTPGSIHLMIFKDARIDHP
jgi:hypothetical protein